MNYILIAFLIFVAFIVFSQYSEHYATYTMRPYNYIKTGTDPLFFYRRDRFRKPYNYPIQFYKSYPTPHMSYFD